MVCDWVGAGIVYSGNKVDFNKPYSEPLEYFNSHLNERIFHPKTKEGLEYLLTIIEVKGVNDFCKYVKKYL